MEFVEAFYEIDVDHDTLISRNDLVVYADRMGYNAEKFVTVSICIDKVCFACHFKCNVFFCKRWMTLFDANKDDVITLQEFCDAMGLNVREIEDKM